MTRQQWSNRFGTLDGQDVGELITVGLYGLPRNTEEIEYAEKAAENWRIQPNVHEVASELASALLAFAEQLDHRA